MTSNIDLSMFPKEPTLADLSLLNRHVEKKMYETQGRFASASYALIATAIIFSAIVILGVFINDSLTGRGIPFTEAIYGRTIVKFCLPSIALTVASVGALALFGWRKQKDEAHPLTPEEIAKLLDYEEKEVKNEGIIPLRRRDSQKLSQMSSIYGSNSIKDLVVGEKNKFAPVLMERKNKPVSQSTLLALSIINLIGGLIFIGLVIGAAHLNICDSKALLPGSVMWKHIAAYSIPGAVSLALGIGFIGAYISKKRELSRPFGDGEYALEFYKQEQFWNISQESPELVIQEQRRHFNIQQMQKGEKK